MAIGLHTPAAARRTSLPPHLAARAAHAPLDYHVARDAHGRYVVTREAQVVGRYHSLQAAQELACACAVSDAEQGAPARVQVHLDGYSLLVFATTDHAASAAV
jgi:hypothetical protein